MKPAAKRKPPAESRTGARTLGAGGGGAGERPPGGMEEAVRHCRRIAADLDADGFGLLHSAPAADRALAPLFDCDFPFPSLYLSAFLDVHEGEMARHVIATSAPLWWCGQASPKADELSALPWALRLASHGGLTPGIAFPCYAERGPNGFVTFWGRRLTLGAGALFDLHARCFALFEAVSLLRMEDNGKRPQMSKRVLECLTLTARGRTSKEIAKLLGLSVHTTNQHLEEAARKLNAVNRIHAVAKAVRLGLIE